MLIRKVLNKVKFSFLIVLGMLISFGSWAQLPSQQEFTALCSKNDHQILGKLLQQASSKEISDWIQMPFSDGNTPLLSAVYISRQVAPFHEPYCLDVIRVLLTAGANARDNDREGRPVLVVAAEGGQTEIVSALLKAGANAIMDNDRQDRSALMVAAERGHKDTVRVLLEAGALVNQPDLMGRSALMLAVEGGHTETVQMILTQEVGKKMVNDADASGWSALLLAASGGHVKTAELLIHYKANINYVHPNGSSALTLAAEHGDYKMIRQLLWAGPGLQHADSTNRTARQIALDGGHDKIANLLLEVEERAREIVKSMLNENPAESG